METVASLLYDFDEIDVEDPMDVVCWAMQSLKIEQFRNVYTCCFVFQDLRALYAQFHVAARDKSEIELHNYLQDKAWEFKVSFM